MRSLLSSFPKWIFPLLMIFSGVIIILSIFANYFGIDPNNSWGSNRVATLVIGLLILIISICFRSIFVKNTILAIYKNRGPLAKWLFIVTAYAIIAVAFLSPLASDKVVPGEYDFGAHINLITQAKKALDEGQFPIRVAPGMNWGYRYPIFQFYSPFPYTIAGLIYKFITPDNAFIAFRFMELLALFISGIFIFRICYLLTDSIKPSFLSGIVYMTAPYFIINIHARSAWTEVMAQGILPMVLFYTLKTYYSTNKLRFILASSFSWFMLCTTHMITFIYSIFFVGFFILLISVPFWKNFRSFILACLPIPIAWLLAWYHLETVIFTPVWVKSFGNPFETNWLTPLYTLLSPISIAPTIQPGVLSDKTPGLNTAIGGITLLGVAYIFYIILTKDEKWKTTKEKTVIISLCAIFILAFFMTWSPVDFWEYLPLPLLSIQFTYRMATFIMWSGAILCSFALVHLFNHQKMTDLSLILGVLIIVMSHASWLNIQNLPPVSVISAMNASYQQNAYQYQLNQGTSTQKPILNASDINADCKQDRIFTVCDIKSLEKNSEIIQLPVYYYPNMLDVTINEKQAEYIPLRIENSNNVLMGVKLEPGNNHIVIQFTGSKPANWVSIIAWVMLISGMVFSSFRNSKEITTALTMSH